MTARRTFRRLSLVAGVVLLLATGSLTGVAQAGVGQTAAVTAATSKVTIKATSVTVAADRKIRVPLACAGTTTCKGNVRLLIGSAVSTPVNFSVPAKRTATVTLSITAAQLTSLRTAGVKAAKVQVLETAPAAVARRSVGITLRAAAPIGRITVATAAATVTIDGKVAMSLQCKGTAGCSGRIAIDLPGVPGTSTSFAVSARATRTQAITLTAGQLTALRAARTVAGSVLLTEVKPYAVAVAKTSLRLTYLPPDPEASEAYLNRNWTPSSYDTCPADLHRSYSVVGPDGKLYPTWHPPVVTDPATGRSCTFGHEHGDNPADSDIYGWVSSFLSSPEYTDRAGIPFGYVSEALDDFAGEHADHVTRHEDNVGHKIIVRNNVRLVAASPRGYLRDSVGQPISCDYLIKVHQGSHSADATINNAHELLYAVRCTDGTELISSTMSRFGDANEFHRSCQPGTVVDTTGSNLPDGDGGRRLIADRDCVKDFVLVNPANPAAYSDMWSLYEVWESFNTLQTADGTVLAEFDPWFAVRNPSRYFWPGRNADGSNGLGYPSDLTWETDPTDNGRVNANPWAAFTDWMVFPRTDPQSAFDGAERDFYLRNTLVANNSGGTVWYADPYGGDAGSVTFTGAVKQWVSSTDNTGYPALERLKYGQDTDHNDGDGVHAPN